MTWTRSPADQPVTSAPTSTTSPATSWPMVRGGLMFWCPLLKILTSVPQVEQLRTRSLTSSGPALGLGHVLEPDVLGCVEAQRLHVASSRARVSPSLTACEQLVELVGRRGREQLLDLVGVGEDDRDLPEDLQVAVLDAGDADREAHLVAVPVDRRRS